MSLIQHRFYPGSSDWGLRPEELYYPGLFELEFYDPFEDFEHFLDRNLRWLNRPERLREAKPQKAEPSKAHKFRVRVNCKGYNQNSVQTNIQDNYLIVTGKEGNRTEGTGDFSIKEFKKTFKLPDNVEKDKLASYLTPSGRLVVEIPLKETEQEEEEKPKTVTEAGVKKWVLKLNMPKNIDPKDIHVTCRERDVIVQVESNLEKKEPGSEVHFYKKFILPENCNLDALKCVYEQNKLEICAPIKDETGKERSIEVQMAQQQAQQQQQQSQTNLPAQAQAQNVPSQTAA